MGQQFKVSGCPDVKEKIKTWNTEAKVYMEIIVLMANHLTDIYIYI